MTMKVNKKYNIIKSYTFLVELKMTIFTANSHMEQVNINAIPRETSIFFFVS